MAKTKPTKVLRTEINHAEVAHYAKLHNLRKDTIYLLIHVGAITPLLAKESDRDVLRAFGLVVRNRPFARQILARFTRLERQDLTENAGMTTKEVRIKKSLMAAAKKGETVTTRHLCADVYSREGKVYTHEKPDRNLIETIAKIRRSLKNQRYHLSKQDPFCSEAELREMDMDYL